MRFGKTAAATAGLLLIGLAGACMERTIRGEESRTVELQGARNVEVRIDMPAGELRLRGADRELLLDAKFEYNLERLKPAVDYRLVGSTGILEVRQARRRGLSVGSVRNLWDLHLSRAVPVELKIDLGAGQSDLDLRGFQLSDLDIDMGVGEMKLDLRGPHRESFRVKIDGGVGSARIHLPVEVGVRVKVDGGLGSVNARGLTKRDGIYVNPAFEESGTLIEIEIDAGIGSIDLFAETAESFRI